jgi:DNA-binding HxlR family transcriptional regulator
MASSGSRGTRARTERPSRGGPDLSGPPRGEIVGRLLADPVAFSCPKCSVVSDRPWQPTLVYTPRAIATLWDTERAPADGVLDELVGETRAAILRALDIPMTTTEMASRLGVTPGAVSQQLSVLRRAGVVDAHRSGRGVYSELTPLGQSLVGLLGG